jgi:SAM-dependent methyltransferase
VTDVREMLGSLYKQKSLRSAFKPFIPTRYRHRIRQWLGRTGGVQWCRVVMNREIEAFMRSLDCPNIDALEISGTGSQGRYEFKSYQTVTFPEYDVCRGPLAREKFDLVIAEQVFEHILRPDLAATNVLRMLRPGGMFVISTPFLLKVHGHPHDLYRWTEDGITQLLETAGFKVIRTGSWGNRDCLFADMAPGLAWTPYNPARHSLQNEPQFAIVVWAFAEKPPEEAYDRE